MYFRVGLNVILWALRQGAACYIRQDITPVREVCLCPQDFTKWEVCFLSQDISDLERI